MVRKWSLALLLFAASFVRTAPARANESRGIDWTQVLRELERALVTSSEQPAATLGPRHAARPLQLDEPSPQNLGGAWFGAAPRVSLVARDWRNSTLLAGDRMLLVEQLRLAASTRMVVGRVRVSHSRVAPFLQVGVGQWRTDRNYMPLAPNVIEVAAQLGIGCELRLSRHWQVAAETTTTRLMRESQVLALPQNTMWSTLLASRVEF